MADWLYESAPPAPASLIAYGVLDAVGMRFGQVDGWLRDPSGEVAMFSMTARLLMRTQRVLIPLGYVTQLDLGRRNVHLREITRRSLDAYSVRFDEGPLPDADLLIDKLRESPYVRPEIRLLLSDPRHIQPLRPTRMWTLGDGRDDPASAPPVLSPHVLSLPAPLYPSPRHPTLSPPRLLDPLPMDARTPDARPVWTPLAPLGDDLVPSWRSLESTPYCPGDDPPAWRS